MYVVHMEFPRSVLDRYKDAAHAKARIGIFLGCEPMRVLIYADRDTGVVYAAQMSECRVFTDHERAEAAWLDEVERIAAAAKELAKQDE